MVDALLPTRRSRTSFLRLIHSLAPSARVRCVVLSTFDGAADDLELGKHNAVYRLTHGTAEEAREGLTPLPALRKWEREYEEPSLAEGASLMLISAACQLTDLTFFWLRRLQSSQPAPLCLLRPT